MLLRIGIIACPILAVVPHGAPAAQIAAVDPATSFMLPPARIGMSPKPAVPTPARSMMRRPAPAQAESGDHRWTLLLKRRTHRFGGMSLLNPGNDPRPRSRSRFLTVGDQVALGDRVAVDLGWHGAAISNANANVTIDGGRDRLRARDWFMPFAGLHYRPLPRMTLDLEHRQGMRAYGDVGETGALGLTRPAYDAVRMRLRPEKSRHTRLAATWSDADSLIALAGIRMEIQDRLRFSGASPLPANAGAVTAEGFQATAERRLTPGLTASLHYEGARVAAGTTRTLAERRIAAEAVWTHARWQAVVTLGRTDPAIVDAGAPSARWRAEAGVSYAGSGPGARPFRIAARLSDPGSVIGTRLAATHAATTLRAVDQRRAIMVSANMGW